MRVVNKPRPPIINGNKLNGHQLYANGNSDHQRPVQPIDETYRRIVIVTSIGYACTLLTIFFLINDEVPKPYMDEIFHIEQARAYCVGNFTQVSVVHFAIAYSDANISLDSGIRRSQHRQVYT